MQPMPSLKLPLIRRGKVREVYSLPGANSGQPGRVLMVASDRISAFDVIMPTPIEGKGRLLTEMAGWWLRFIERERLTETHLVSMDVADIPEEVIVPAGVQTRAEARNWLRGRVTIGRKCRVVPIECVVRGYLEGSGWKEYQATGEVCGVRLPRGLRQCDKLPEPIFTPATKAASGHDENISFERAAESLGNEGLETMGYLRDVSLSIYQRAAAHALARGIIIADTKFEFGVPDLGGPDMSVTADAFARRVWVPPILIDEALTPDSSRFWEASKYEPGRAQPSFDKQFLREYLETLVKEGKWNKQEPGPQLPPNVVDGTLARYREARDRLCVS